MEKKKVYVSSTLPYYIAGIEFVVYTYVFQCYRIVDFVIALLIMLGVFLGAHVMIGKKEVEIEVLQEHTSKDEYCHRLLQECYDYLKTLISLKEQMEKPSVVADIDAIIETSQAIFTYIAQYPQKAREVRKFVNYYYPTLINLLKNYDTLENQHQDIDVITDNMKKVEETLTVFKEAFKKQYEMLFDDHAMDIQSDIDVMEMMLTQDGLKEIIKMKENVK